ncbi:hypothetical protein DPEC_G00116880 [Dallia pectoralis]|uniref:Uncharacterized protein n=1 Tax=Dallia pectoralis TaxID=75939 RepID=A0ACC2GUY4_DALPE|nr:hypothetical protein DPEC_G00116880 [Dallia pectoralis]
MLFQSPWSTDSSPQQQQAPARLQQCEMGCGNSSTKPVAGADPAEGAKEVAEESSQDEEKRMNYGGVYVGLPADLSSMPPVQIGSHKGGNQWQVIVNATPLGLVDLLSTSGRQEDS